MEVLLAKVWSEALGAHLATIGPRTHFFDVGGNSLTAMRMLQILQKALAKEGGGVGADASAELAAEHRQASLCCLHRKPRLREYSAFLEWERTLAPNRSLEDEAVFRDWVGVEESLEKGNQNKPDQDTDTYDVMELGPRALAYASRHGIRSVAESLLVSKVSPDGFVTRHNKAVSPLMHAALTGQTAALRLLLEWKAQPGLVTSKHSNAVHLAAMHSPPCLDLLLDAPEVSLTARDMNLWGYLHFAAWGAHNECIDLLLSKKADPTNRDRWGRTPLFWAVQQGSVEIVERLATAHAQTGKWAMEQPQKKHQRRHGNAWTTPLHLSIRAGYTGQDIDFRMLRSLLSAGVPVDGKDDEGRSALHLAASQMNMEALNEEGVEESDAKEILKANTDMVLRALAEVCQPATLDAKDSQGNRPLHEAAGAASPYAVELLLEKRAHPTRPNDTGKSPTMVALEAVATAEAGGGAWPLSEQFAKQAAAHLARASEDVKVAYGEKKKQDTARSRKGLVEYGGNPGSKTACHDFNRNPGGCNRQWCVRGHFCEVCGAGMVCKCSPLPSAEKETEKEHPKELADLFEMLELKELHLRAREEMLEREQMRLKEQADLIALIAEEEAQLKAEEEELRWYTEREDQAVAAAEATKMDQKAAAAAALRPVVEQMFATFDVDKSSFLDYDEVKVLCTHLGLRLNEDQFNEVMKTMDDDKSGKVDFEEYFNWYVGQFTEAEKLAAEKQKEAEEATTKQHDRRQRDKELAAAKAREESLVDLLKQQRTEAEKLQTEGESMKTRLTQSRVEIEALVLRQGELETENKRVMEAREELKLKLKEAESANLMQEAVLEETREQLKATQMQVAEIIEEKESLGKALEKQAQQAQHLQDKLDESIAENNALRFEAQAKQHQAELEIFKLTASLQTEQDTGKRLQGLVDATEAKLANETQSHAATSKDVEEASKTGSRLQSDLENMREELTHTVTTMKQEHKSATLALKDESKSAVATLKDESKQALSTLRKDAKAALRAAVNERNGVIANLEERLSAATSASSALGTQHSDNSIRMVSLQERLREKEAELASSNSELSKVNGEFTTFKEQALKHEASLRETAQKSEQALGSSLAISKEGHETSAAKARELEIQLTQLQSEHQKAQEVAKLREIETRKAHESEAISLTARVQEKEKLSEELTRQGQDLQARLNESQAEKSALRLDAQAKQHQAELEISKLTASLQTERETAREEAEGWARANSEEKANLIEATLRAKQNAATEAATQARLRAIEVKEVRLEAEQEARCMADERVRGAEAAVAAEREAKRLVDREMGSCKAQIEKMQSKALENREQLESWKREGEKSKEKNVDLSQQLDGHKRQLERVEDEVEALKMVRASDQRQWEAERRQLEENQRELVHQVAQAKRAGSLSPRDIQEKKRRLEEQQLMAEAEVLKERAAREAKSAAREAESTSDMERVARLQQLMMAGDSARKLAVLQADRPPSSSRRSPPRGRLKMGPFDSGMASYDAMRRYRPSERVRPLQLLQADRKEGAATGALAWPLRR